MPCPEALLLLVVPEDITKADYGVADPRVGCGVCVLGLQDVYGAQDHDQDKTKQHDTAHDVPPVLVFFVIGGLSLLLRTS